VDIDIKETIATLEAVVQDPTKGLPEELFLFVSRITPLINVDLLIKDERNHTLLTWRDDGYWAPGWHVPGGIIRYKEKIADRVKAVANSELGAEVEFNPAPLAMNEFIYEHMKSRGHFISLLYQCRLVTEPDGRLRCSGKPKPEEWMWHACCPGNIITPHEVYRKYI
jgi:ADP-ribose pyrophosphatase YjhB (NUDIX family)